MDPEPGVFGPYFDNHPPATLVLAVPNLDGTAMMLVPRGLGELQNYTHLAAFLRHAPEAQVQALWQCVAETAQSRVSDRPLWISTAGGGVAWLHVRIERMPKYYGYRPYANAA